MRNLMLFILVLLILFPISAIMNVYVPRPEFWPGTVDSSDTYPNTWWLSVGGPMDDQAWMGIFVDEQGYVYCTGYTSSWKPLGSTSLFLVKNSRYGENVRSIVVYGNSTIYGRDVIVMDDNIFIAGQVTGYGAGSLDGFLVKLDDGGNVEWFNTVGGTGGDLLWSLDSGYNDTIYATGYTFSYATGKNDIFVVKFDSDGRLLWALALGGGLFDYGWSIDTYTNETTDFVVVGGQTTSFPVGGSHDGYVALLTGEGMVQWTLVFGSPALDAVQSVTFDSEGYIYVAGNTKNTTTGENDVFVAKFNLDGELLWITSFGGNESEIPYGIAVDENFVYVAGYTASYITGELGEEDAFVAALDKSTGDVLTFMNFGGPDIDFGYAIAIDNDYVYVTGKTGSFTEGGKDLFQVKFRKDFIFDSSPPDLVWVYDDFPENVNTSVVPVPYAHPSFNMSFVTMDLNYVTPAVYTYSMPAMLVGSSTHLATATGEPPAEVTTTTVTLTTTVTNTTTVTTTETYTTVTTETVTETVTETETITETETFYETVTETINNTLTETTTVTDTVTETYTTTETFINNVTYTTTETETETVTETETATETETYTTTKTVSETVYDWTVTVLVGIVLLIIGLVLGRFTTRSV